MMKNAIFLALCFLLLSVAGHALDVTQGNVRLTLYEKTGRFNVFVSKTGENDKPFSFFVKEDPRTTVLQVLVDNAIFTSFPSTSSGQVEMGDEGGFRQTVAKTDSGARFVWRSARIRVSQEFIFLTPQDAPLTEGVKIVIKVDNVSERAQTVGVRLLFDTYLGESSGTHFITSANAMVAREAAVKTPGGGSYWISPFISSATGDGLLVLTDAQYVTQPEAVVFANWKRLFEANWEYRSMPNLDFNYQPYSFNDSAVCHYYPKLKIEKKSGREIVMVLGNAASYAIPKTTLIAEKKTDDDASEKNKLLDVTDRPVEENPVAVAKRNVIPITRFSGSIIKPLSPSNYDLVKYELARLDKYVEELNAKILTGKKVTVAEIDLLRTTLSEIETKAMQKE